MKINIYSYNEAKNNDKIYNWISVRDIGWDNLYEEFDNNKQNVLKVYFDDVTPFSIKHNLLPNFYKEHVLGTRDFVLFNEKMAQDILDFANKVYSNGEELNIHCWAGKSRSQAIGAFLNTFFNLFGERNINDYLGNIERSNERYMANSWVTHVFNDILNKKF